MITMTTFLYPLSKIIIVSILLQCPWQSVYIGNFCSLPRYILSVTALIIIQFSSNTEIRSYIEIVMLGCRQMSNTIGTNFASFSLVTQGQRICWWKQWCWTNEKWIKSCFYLEWTRSLIVGLFIQMILHWSFRWPTPFSRSRWASGNLEISHKTLSW